MSGTARAAILELQNVCFRYPDGSTGLDRCSLSIHSGSRTAVLGANGSGKTTLFLHLNGILRPQSGTIACSGKPLTYTREGLHALRSRIGLVFQNPDSQLFSASVREDVSFGPINQGLNKQTVRERVEEALCSVGMQDCAEKPVQNLSYGQKKRVCIAGVLAMRPEILILDEPMGGLDPAMQNDLEKLLHRLHADGMTILLATHDIDFAYRWADQLHLMVNGHSAVSCAAAHIAEAAGQLPALGLRVPEVMHLYQILAAKGLVPPGESPPRSLTELAQLLE
jgi:cobalt/nickel transport system ATP-binding protein